MTAATETNLLTAEARILRTFAAYEATTLATSLLFDDAAPLSTADVARALTRMENEHILLRFTWDGSDWVTLTLRGVAQRGGAPSPRAPSGHPEIIYEHPHRIRARGTEYSVYVLGIERSDGTWAGWLELVSHDGAERLRTGQESSQPNRDALAYWASGLEDVYLEGALSRAAK